MDNFIQTPTLTNEDVSSSQASYLFDFQGEGEILVISFGFYAYDAIPNFDFFGRLKKIELLTGKKINKLLLRDKSNSWYHYGIEGLGNDVDETVASLKRIIKQIKPSKVVTIGQSMGAYAAIMFGSLLNVDKVLAFGTLAFFNSKRTELSGDTRWLGIMQEVEKNPPKVFYNDLCKLVEENDKSTKISIYYGIGVSLKDISNNEGVHLDTMHSMLFEKYPNVTLKPYPSDHVIIEYLRKNHKLNAALIKELFDMEFNEKPDSLTISNDWKKWVLENILNGNTAETLIPLMVQSGLDEKASKLAIAEVNASPYLSVARQYQEKLHKREWLLNTLDSLKRSNEYYTKPKKVPLPPFKDFLRDYYFENRIGIFTGAIDNWPAANWTMDSLAEKVGKDSVVEVQTGREKSEHTEINGPSLKTEMKFGDFINKITSTESSNDLYLTANNHSFKNPNLAKLLNDIGDIGDGYFNVDRFVDSSFLWLGPKGVITPFHHDLTNNFFIQIKGKKLYHLIPAMQAPHMYDSNFVYSDVNLLKPDFDKFPEFAKNSIIEVDLDPGDCLFIPIGCWHHVIGLTENISMTLTNMNVNNSFPGYPHGGQNSYTSANTDKKKVVDYVKLANLPILDSSEVIKTDKAQVCVIEDFLSKEECDKMIELINSNLQPSQLYRGQSGTSLRTSSTCNLSYLDDPFIDLIDKKIADRLGINVNFGEPIQGQKYEAGQEYKGHVDCFTPGTEEYSLACGEKDNRTWTFMIYLNTPEKGGETNFPTLGKVIKARRGTAVAWNNLDENGNPNYNTLHAGTPVIEGEKIILTKWFREKGEGEMFL